MADKQESTIRETFQNTLTTLTPESPHIAPSFVIPDELNENEKDLINAVLNDRQVQVIH